MANVSHAASGNVWTRAGHGREGYAWCASLSIDAACTPKVKGGTGVWFYHGGTEDEGTRRVLPRGGRSRSTFTRADSRRLPWPGPYGLGGPAVRCSFCRCRERPLRRSRSDDGNGFRWQIRCQASAQPDHWCFHHMIERYGQADAEHDQDAISNGGRLIFEEDQCRPLRMEMGQIDSI